MTTSNNISSMKLCYMVMSFTLPKQSQRSRSILNEGSRFLALFLEETETLSYNRRITVFKSLSVVNQPFGVNYYKKEFDLWGANSFLSEQIPCQRGTSAGVAYRNLCRLIQNYF